MLGRSLHSAAPLHQAVSGPNAPSRLLQPCQLPQGAVGHAGPACRHRTSTPAGPGLYAGLAAAPSRPGQQQQQLYNSTHVVRVVALQQDDSFQLDKQQECFHPADTHDTLEVVPETGLLPEVVDRLDSNSSASTSTRSSLASKVLGNSRKKARKVANSTRSRSSSGSSSSTTTIAVAHGNPIHKAPTAAAAAAAAAANTSSTSGAAAAAAAAAADSTSTGGLAVVVPAGSGGSSTAAAAAGASSSGVRALYPPSERSQIQESWDALMRWSKSFRRQRQASTSPIEAADKVVVFGGGSFGTAMGTSLAHKKPDLDVVLLLRDPYLCHDINSKHINTKYLGDFKLPRNVRATTDAAEAIAGASYAVHAVPVQHSRAFLSSIKEVLPKAVPIICVSKGLEVGTGCMMSEVIPSALGRRQPAVFLSGPSFAKEVMQGRPTGVVAACKDINLGREVQELFASPNMRVNTTTDVTGVEICGALKNVLAIAAGIVEGLDLGHNALAALIAQGCAEIRWLSQKVGAKPATISGLSGLGDIMLTCYGDLSRNRSVGIRLGRGERLEDILASSSQVAEGVATAGVVVGLARKYRVSLPVLTAVAQVLDNNLTPAQAVTAVMNLPQIDEM